MQKTKLILSAREAVENYTPLKADCGQICGSACCKDDGSGEIVGMELFPGEELLYDKSDVWYKLYYTRSKTILVCEGSCPRGERPLACRIFPLMFYDNSGELSVRMDIRAASLCPLYEHGKKGLSKEFVEAVKRAGDILWQDSGMRGYISKLSVELNESRNFL